MSPASGERISSDSPDHYTLGQTCSHARRVI